MEATMDSAVNRNLRVLGTDLPLLATDAAIELERILANEPIGIDSISELSALMAGSFALQRDPHAKAVYDPATLDVVKLAFEAVLQNAPSSIDELIRKAQEVAQSFPKDESRPEKDQEIVRLRDFCLALANISAEYRQSLFGTGPQHPYKKSHALRY